MDGPDPITCAECGRDLRPGASFCGACGTRVGAVRTERGAESGAIAALAVTFAGALVTLLLVAAFPTDRELVASALAYTGFVLVGLAGCAALGRGGLRASFAGPSTERWIAVGLAGGALSFAVSFGYVEGLARLVGDGGELGFEPARPPLFVELLDTALVTPLVEEWLCRGVLFVACTRVIGARGTLVLTSALFALLHGLEGYVLSVPHRFVAGLVFGWLRQRSGSLVPGIVGHALHNGLAVLVGRVSGP